MPNYLIVSTDNGQDMELHNNASIVSLPDDQSATSLIYGMEDYDNFFITNKKIVFTGDCRLICEYNEVGSASNNGKYNNTSVYSSSKLPENKKPYAVAITCNINEFDILWDEEDYNKLIDYYDGLESDFISNFKQDGHDFIDDGENYIKIIKL